MKQITINLLTILTIGCFFILIRDKIYETEFLKTLHYKAVYLISFVFSLVLTHFAILVCLQVIHTIKLLIHFINYILNR